MLADIFAKMDADKSDYVDADEFKSIFSDIAARHASERMVEIDGIADRGDSDGRLTQQEFVDFMLEYYALKGAKAMRRPKPMPPVWGSVIVGVDVATAVRRDGMGDAGVRLE